MGSTKSPNRTRIVNTAGRRLLAKAIRDESARADGRTQRQIATLLGASEKSLWAWRAGTRRPGELLKARLSEMFGIEPSTWLTADERRQFERRPAAA